MSELRRATGTAERLFGKFGIVFDAGCLWPTGDTGACNPVVAEVRSEAQGSYIARAVNAHEELASALDLFVRLGDAARMPKDGGNTAFVDSRDLEAALSHARAALAKARGG